MALVLRLSKLNKFYKVGTHSLSIEVNATYQNAGQPDFPLRGRVTTSLIAPRRGPRRYRGGPAGHPGRAATPRPGNPERARGEDELTWLR